MARRAPRQNDLKLVEEASSYAAGRREDMINLSTDVGNMGWIRRRWDSKVPEKKKWFFNRVSFKESDQEDIQEEIAIYEDFYRDMKTAMREVRDGEADAEELIEDLFQKLLQMQLEAKSKISSTDSSTLYRLHQEFVERHEVLENRIKRVEVVAVRQQLRRTREDLQGAVNEIRNLTERFDRLMTVNEQLVEQQRELRQENTLIRTLLEEVIRGGGVGGGTGQI